MESFHLCAFFLRVQRSTRSKGISVMISSYVLDSEIPITPGIIHDVRLMYDQLCYLVRQTNLTYHPEELFCANAPQDIMALFKKPWRETENVSEWMMQRVVMRVNAFMLLIWELIMTRIKYERLSSYFMWRSARSCPVLARSWLMRGTMRCCCERQQHNELHVAVSNCVKLGHHTCIEISGYHN